MRKIIHIDMDAFFASVEQRDHPEYQGKPIAVGFDGPRGVVSTASYEARRYGVHSAMSIMMAKKMCPDLLIVGSNFKKYKQVSNQVYAIFHEYTDLIEPISIDEAFLDVTSNIKSMDLAVDVAKDIRQRINETLGLTASAGVSYNRLLAKIASDFKKPDGLCVVHPDVALDFIGRLPVGNLWGIGHRTAERMHQMGVFNVEQLRQITRNHLVEIFGKVGNIYYEYARGIDNRPVVPQHVRKSIGCEQTYLQDISLKSVVLIELYHLVIELVRRIEKVEFEGSTLTLKVKYSNFDQTVKSMTTAECLKTKEQILPMAKQLLNQVSYSSDHAIRLIGLSVSNSHPQEQESAQDRLTEGYLPFEDLFL